ncbi:MAG: hypothetical protein JWQ33_126 [Ramlibacter sp.]|nr:hypothetical protein [Ramlibacter sp.]
MSTRCKQRVRWAAVRQYDRAMSLRGFACRVLLSVLLVFVQQQGMLHELQHAFDELAQKGGQHTPQKDVCPTCVAFAGVHHAAGGSAPILPPTPYRHARPTGAVFASASSAFIAAYLSRAPPPARS